VKSALKRARAKLEQELGQPSQRIAPPLPASRDERDLVGRFVQALVDDDIEGVIALVTEDAWFRMPPAHHEYQGPELIGRFLAAVAGSRSGPSRLVATRANGQPAFGTYHVDPTTRLAYPIGLLVLSLHGTRIADLTWFLHPNYLDRFGLPSAPFVDTPVSISP
jgi:hypothetical protein